MGDIVIGQAGHAGRITLARPEALNALTHEMCLAVATALHNWRDDPTVAVVILDAEGDRAFCAGGDIVGLYASGMQGQFGVARGFWADEYRLNHTIFHFPKPIIAFLQGFTMGGGVGLGCHGSHRVVGNTSRIAMPECGIGLVPDVGGTLMLALAPGRLGEYLGLTATRMHAGDAIHAGFADHYVPEDLWPTLIERMEKTGDAGLVAKAAQPAPESALAAQADDIDRFFADGFLEDILSRLRGSDDGFAQTALIAMDRNSPLSMACTIEILRRLRRVHAPTLSMALDLEYRFTYRSMEQGEFLEGIRATVIDRDRNPGWRHNSLNVPEAEVAAMLAPLGEATLKLCSGEKKR